MIVLFALKLAVPTLDTVLAETFEPIADKDADAACVTPDVADSVPLADNAAVAGCVTLDVAASEQVALIDALAACVSPTAKAAKGADARGLKPNIGSPY